MSAGPIFHFGLRSAAWVGHYRGPAIVIALGLILEAAFTASVPLAFRMVIDRAIVPRDTTLLVTLVVAMMIGVVVVAAVGLWRDYLYARMCSLILRDLRVEIFDQLHRLTPSSAGSEENAGETAHFSTDLAAIEHAIVSAVPWALLPGLDVVIGTTLLFILEWRLAVIAALVFPLALIGPRLVAPHASRASRDRKNQEASVLADVQESISARQTVRAFRLEEAMRGRFAGRVDDLVISSTRTSFLGALVERSAGIGILFLQVVVLGVGALMAFEGLLTIGTLVSFQALFMTVSWSLSYVTQYVPNLVVASGGLQRIDDYLAAQAPVVDLPGAYPVPRCSREITFEGVVYGFPGMPPILRGLDLSLRAGERVAIVGPIGSGKSSILRLLTRIADPSGGRILIDGHDIRSGTQESLRRQIGVVFQDGLLLNDTIRANIRLGKMGATDSEVEAVAALVGLHDLLEQLPHGYDTVVGPRGERLSGGQRQLVAIARAVLRDPAILLLDEPTSALDPYSDRIVRLAIEHVSRGPTVIAVTHRRELAAEADRVLVVKDGRLVEDGNHASLLRAGTLYSRLWWES